MQSRQSGAAHVPIMFFLILLVMFLGALGYAFVVTDANTNLRTDKDKLESANREMTGKALLWEHYAEDIQTVFGISGTYSGRATAQELYNQQTLDGMKVMSPADARKKIEDFGTSIGIAKTGGLDDLFSAVASKLSATQKRATDAEVARDTAMTDKSKVDASFADATTTHSRSASDWSRTMDTARATFNADVARRDGTIQSLQANLVQMEASLNSEREARAAERLQLQNEIGKLRMHNTALANKDKLRYPADVADGRVISARHGLANAFISLGRKDMLQAGTEFRLRSRGSNAIKGYATVVRVEQDKAEVMLHSVVDALGNPVSEGDELYNDLYSPGRYQQRTIYLMGHFGYPYNKPQLEQLLVNLGNTVVKTMAPGVDTVILGNNLPTAESDGVVKIEDTDEYKKAIEWGVEFAPLAKIRDLIRL